MARYNDSSSDCRNWTNLALMKEARKLANLETFRAGNFHSDGPVTFKPGWANQNGSPDIADFCREQTRIYRTSWLTPILDEIERRFVKS